MSKEVIVSVLKERLFDSSDGLFTSHPSFDRFCQWMKARDYGDEALITAWLWYRKGWDDHP